jgi:CRP-like cAMP-binding protein
MPYWRRFPSRSFETFATPLDGWLARWLLMFHDRGGSVQFFLTQEFLASMLGVRRAGVSNVAAKLQQMGLIAYERGKFSILDLQGLEGLTCECYGVIKARFDNMLL